MTNMNVDTSALSSQGLSSQKASELLKVYGKNELVKEQGLGRLKQFLKLVSDPMGLMMLGLSLLYWLTGNSEDAIIILIAYVPVTAVDVILELKSEKALKALKSNLRSSAKVFRDGKVVDLPIDQIVPGDVLAFEEGQSLPADGKMLECHNLMINEAALTGESLPIDKKLADSFFAGTSVISGRGLGLIDKTGQSTQFGKISHLLDETEEQDTPLQKKVNSLVRKILYLAAVLVILLFCIDYIRSADLLKSLITALTFGMAAVPEEFPLVFVLYLSMGAYRLSKHGVLVKTLPSVESLGNVDVICTDKTGTLTEGRFALIEIVPFGSLSSQEREQVALLACEPSPVDAMEIAIMEKLKESLSLKDNWNLKYDYPFEPQGKHMTHIWSNDSGDSILAMKGAVEGVLEHCELKEMEREEILKSVHRLASEGRRILGLATRRASFSGVRTEDEKGLGLIGLLVFSDPIRSSAKAAIQECQKAGIEVKMLTGDHLLTAHAIADELEIDHTHQALFSGSQLSTFTAENRIQAYLRGAIFARISPEQKYELVKTLKDHQKIVAMTGDGVNDAPALKLADIGVSMGENATDVARSTAKMILMKNDFNGIVQAILEGRSIFSNLRRSFSYLIAFHIPVVLLSLIPPLLGFGQLLLPIHIILLEFIVHPISAFAFENLKTPGKKTRSLVPTSVAITAIISGVLLSLIGLLPMLLENLNLDQIRSLTLAIVLFGNIGFTFVEAWPNYRSRKIWSISLVLFLLPIVICNTDFFAQLFRLNPLSMTDLCLAFVLGSLASVPTFVYRHFINNEIKNSEI
jgi:Ca2+-transporting ATPase